MQFESTVLKVEDFISKKGNSCAFVWVTIKGSAIPFKILAYNDTTIAKAKSALAQNQPLRLEISQDSNLSPRVEISR